MTREIIDKVTEAHIDRLILDGTITVNKVGNPRDISIYLRSAKFSQFQACLHMTLAKMEAPQNSC